MRVHSQGLKRKQVAEEARLAGLSKPWNKGAPLSHKSKGVGRGSNGHGPSGKFMHAGGEQRDPQLPTTVPMPRAVEDITDAGMRAMWEMDGEVAQEPLD